MDHRIAGLARASGGMDATHRPRHAGHHSPIVSLQRRDKPSQRIPKHMMDMAETASLYLRLLGYPVASTFINEHGQELVIVSH